MALTVTHAKNISIADDPKAAAAGEVLPSDWNADHVVTGVALEQAGSNLTFYVATTGSDSNPGTAPLPFATIQHALNVCATFDYQNLYFPTVNVADGTYDENVVLPYLLNAVDLSSVFATSGYLTGNLTTWTNCKIAPTNGSGEPNLFWPGLSHWQARGFSLVADPNVAANSTSINMMQIYNYSFGTFGSIDFNIGTTSAVSQFFFVRTFSRSGAVGDFTFQGTGATNGFGEAQGISYAHVGDNTWTFNSSFTCSNNNLFEAFASKLLGIGGITFVNPGNITGAGNQFGLSFGSSVDMEGVDPATVTWPGLATFTPVGIDESSDVDGFFYAQQISGLPTTANLYKFSWGFFKDTSGGGIYAAYNDAGTIKKVALT